MKLADAVAPEKSLWSLLSRRHVLVDVEIGTSGVEDPKNESGLQAQSPGTRLQIRACWFRWGPSCVPSKGIYGLHGVLYGLGLCTTWFRDFRIEGL